MKDRASRRAARKQRKADRAASRALAMARLRRTMTIAMSLAVAAGLAAGVVVGAPRLESQIIAASRTQPVQVVFAWPQAVTGDTWLPQDVRDQILASAHHELGRLPDPFSPAALKGVADAALRSGWVERIDRVIRSREGDVQVEVQWRIPTAVVRRDGSDYLVGRRGEILPLVFRRDGSPLKVIIGAAKEPVMQGQRPAPGQVWPGADLQAGLELLALISSRPWAEQVAAVDVSEYLARKELVLITKWNGKVVWGGAPSETIPGQLSTAAKLGRIDALHKRYSRIDVSKRLVDVTSVYTMIEDTATANSQP